MGIAKNNLQVLMATIDQRDDSLLDAIRLQSDIIVCNQNKNNFSKKIYKKNGYNVEWYNFDERGTGLNRNNALLRATADFCLLADDDVEFVDKYNEIIVRNFQENKNADVIIFNIESPGKNRFTIKKKMKINRLNYGRFGAVRIAFRRKSIIKNNISFNTLFGGGAKYGSGEDTIFLHDCIKNKLRVIAVPDNILTLKETRDSTWFNGFDEKFFINIGALYSKIYGKFAMVIAEIQLWRKKEWLSIIDKKNIRSKISEGIREYRNYEKSN